VTDISPVALDASSDTTGPATLASRKHRGAPVALTGEPVVQLDQIPLDVALARSRPRPRTS
jgi:hypothetical protein